MTQQNKYKENGKMLSFLILSYNHEKYILQNLESIKYQIIQFGKDYCFELIVSDDCSIDRSFDLIKEWCERNADLFETWHINRNERNLGTSKNLANSLCFVTGEYLKLLGGDDLLPYTSIFPFIEALQDNDMVMGLPLYFDKNGGRTNEMKSHLQTELWDEKVPYNKRIIKPCFIHSPSVYLRSQYATDQEMINFIRTFMIIDDYPMWLKFAQYQPLIRYKFIPKVAVLYRRTSGSIYIIQNKAFLEDRIILCRYALKLPSNLWCRFTKYNEILALRVNTTFFSKYFQLYNYILKLGHLSKNKTANMVITDLNDEINENMAYINKINEEVK